MCGAGFCLSTAPELRFIEGFGQHIDFLQLSECRHWGIEYGRTDVRRQGVGFRVETLNPKP